MNASAIAAVMPTIVAQPDHAAAMTQLRQVADELRARCAPATGLLGDSAEDILACRVLRSSTAAVAEHQCA